MECRESENFSTCEGPYSYLNRSSCHIAEAEKGIYDAVMANRTVSSSLSVIGTLSIIILVIGKRQVFNPKVHPIFALSVADLLLACSWTVGASFWSRGIEDRRWCLLVHFLTVVLQCISINMALVYATYAYITITRNTSDDKTKLDTRAKIVRPLVTLSIYIIACIIPVVLVGFSLGIVLGTSEVFRQSETCSCWCRPVLGNVLPYANPMDKPTAIFVNNVRKLIEAFAVILSTNYCVVFVTMIVIYNKLLKYIKKIRLDGEKTYDGRGGSANQRENINSGYSKAKIRVFLFLLVFIINGLSNFLLTLGFASWEAWRLGKKNGMCGHPQDRFQSRPHQMHFFLLIINSFLPLQGFLNAIVYGWTREDFVMTVAFAESYDMPITPSAVASQKSCSRATSITSTYKEEASMLDSLGTFTKEDYITDNENLDDDD